MWILSFPSQASASTQNTPELVKGYKNTIVQNIQFNMMLQFPTQASASGQSYPAHYL